MKNKPKILLAAILVAFCPIGFATAESLPTPETVFSAATNFWIGNDLAGFATYTTNLYSGAATNYAPAILLSAFHDYVFEGKLVTASNKYARVGVKLTESPQSFSDTFKGLFSMVSDSVNYDIKRYNQANKPLTDAEALAIPQAIRDDAVQTDFPIPHLFIIRFAPDLNL